MAQLHMKQDIDYINEGNKGKGAPVHKHETKE
jgi:hypothetical protein